MKRIFLPSLVDDNRFLMQADPAYKERLLALPERERKALLYGDWNIFEGQYFTEFQKDRHVIRPFPIPREWRKFRTVDYGLDRLACLWIAVSPDRQYYVYREYCESGLPISRAAAAILENTPPGEEIYATLAPPDLFSRSQESGQSKALLFRSYGVPFTKTDNDRETGWLCVKELLAAEEADLTSFTPAEAEAFSELYETMKTRVGEISALLLCGVGGALLYVTKAYLLPRLPSTCPALARLLHRGETEKSPPEELPPDPVFCEDDTDEV